MSESPTLRAFGNKIWPAMASNDWQRKSFKFWYLHGDQYAVCSFQRLDNAGSDELRVRVHVALWLGVSWRFVEELFGERDEIPDAYHGLVTAQVTPKDFAPQFATSDGEWRCTKSDMNLCADQLGTCLNAVSDALRSLIDTTSLEDVVSNLSLLPKIAGLRWKPPFNSDFMLLPLYVQRGEAAEARRVVDELRAFGAVKAADWGEARLAAGHAGG